MCTRFVCRLLSSTLFVLVANLTLLTDPSAYTQIELGNGAQGNSLQWRYDTDSEQLEFKFTMPENSWIAVGLRNKEAGFKCASLLNSKDSNTLDGLNSENSLNQNLNIRKIVGNYLSTTASPESRELFGISRYISSNFS